MSESSDLKEEIGAVKSGGGWMVALGFLTVFLGFVALGTPFITTVYVAMIVGIVLVVSGIFQIAHGFGAQGWKGKLFEVLIGLLAVIGGSLIISRPAFGAAVFALVIAGYFTADGIVSIAMSFKLKPEKGWGWMLFSGIVSFILGVFIWRQWPLGGMVAVGVLVGIRMVMAGWAMVVFGSVARQMAGAAEEGRQAEAGA